MLSCNFFYPLHLYVFVLICQYYVVLLERANKDIIYITVVLSFVLQLKVYSIVFENKILLNVKKRVLFFSIIC